MPSRRRASIPSRTLAIRHAPLCPACRAYAGHPGQSPIAGHHPSCPTLCRNPWTESAADTGAWFPPMVAIDPNVAKPFMARVDSGYDALQKSLEAQSQTLPTFGPSQLQYAGEWAKLFSEWKGFYLDVQDDPLVSQGEYTRAQGFHDELLRYSTRFEQAFKTEAPALPGKTTDPLHGQSQDVLEGLEKAMGIVKWTVLGYLGYRLLGAVKK